LRGQLRRKSKRGGEAKLGLLCVAVDEKTSERMKIRELGRHCQLQINGTRGRTVVRAVVVHARANIESHRRKL
jgi:hypothetical protein